MGNINFILFFKISFSQIGTVESFTKISATESGFNGVLDYNDQFGYCITGIDDINGDQVNDIAITAYGDNDGGTDKGAVWVITLNNDGTVNTYQKISATEGEFTGNLDNEDYFGKYITHFKTGAKELAVGAYGDDDGRSNRGAVWILDLNSSYVSINHLTYQSDEMFIFPNPASDFISISMKDFTFKNFKFVILREKSLKKTF